MTIEEAIGKLDSVRGIWKGYTFDEDGSGPHDGWTVTFIYKGHYVETPDMDTPLQVYKL